MTADPELSPYRTPCFPLRDERVSRGEVGEKTGGLAMNFLSMLFSKNLSRILKKVAAVNRLSEPA